MGNINSIIKLKKEDLYDAYYKVCRYKALGYGSLSRKEIADRIINHYNEDIKYFYSVLCDYEIDFVKNNLNSTTKDKIAIELSKLLIYSIDDNYILSITEEIKNSIIESIKEYELDKDNIEKDKLNAYFLVGIFRCYGKLKVDEIKNLSKRYFNDNRLSKYLNHPYVERFVQEDNFCDNAYSLSGVVDRESILTTHAKTMKTFYDYDYILTIGKYYIDINHPCYQKLYATENGKKFLDKCYTILAESAGTKNISKIMYGKYYGRENLSDQEGAWFEILCRSLPDYYLNDKKKCNVEKEVCDLFYSVFLQYLSYSAHKRNKEIMHGETCNEMAAFETLKDECDSKFKNLESYISSTNLSSDQIEMLKGFRNGILSPFIALKHTNNGTIFVGDNDTFYLVKGLISCIDEMIPIFPMYVQTFIFPFRGQYICSGLLSVYPFSLGPNLRRRYNDLYKNNKDNILGDK